VTTVAAARGEAAPLRALLGYLLWLGTAGFGGPIALVGYMQRDLVERRRLVTESEFRDGLALAQLAPGPLAAQLAIYLGWVRGGAWGATLAGAAFVAPSFLMVLVLSAAYVRVGGMPWMQGAFYGIGAAVIAIIGRSAVKLLPITLGRDRLLWAIAAVCAVTTAWLGREVVWLFVASGLFAAAWRGRGVAEAAAPAFAGGAVTGGFSLAGALGGRELLSILAYFAGAGMFVFGSGLAIVPFLHGGVVERLGWLTERQFLDAIAVAMITPGPVVITVAFIGYLVAGMGGAVAAAVGVFAPVWLVTLLVAPHYHRVASHAGVRGFVQGVTAAATGAIAGAAVVLARRALVDWTAVVLCLVIAVVLFLPPRRLPEPLVISLAGAVGYLVS
jgi:chromate transporter